MAVTNITWTERQQEIAKLFREGSSFSEIKKLGHNPKSISDVQKALEAGNFPPGYEELPSNPSNEVTPKSKKQVKGLPVGQIVIMSLDWQLSQDEAFLISDTYGKVKRDYNYSGTIGNFLSYCVEMVRMYAGYNVEVKDNGQYGNKGESEIERGYVEEGDTRELEPAIKLAV